MDQNCTQRKATVPEVRERIREYLEFHSTNIMSANYHLFFNGNYKKYHIEYCIKQCIKSADVKGEELGKVLLSMSDTQRKKLTHSGGY